MEVSNLRPSVCKTDALTAELIAHMARLAGLEPAALASAGLRSIQLSYKRIFLSCQHSAISLQFLLTADH